ncbi:MAG: hypothetical protein IKE55_06020 [Kiritimatiellae bacterium]|nr:hypothetical protein [Kiritimatiellia bacterium]
MRSATAGAFSAAMFALALSAAGSQPPAEDVGGTVMPYGLGAFNGDTDRIAERLREVKARGGISRFVMSGPGHKVRVSGIMDVSGYAALGRRIGELRRKVAADGMLVGYKMMPTMNCGIKHPWRKFTLTDGKTREFTACPGEEGFRRDFAAKCAAIAGAGRPFLYLMDDDFRYYSLGCFCEDHLRRFAELTGVRRDRREMVGALRAEGGEGHRLRMAWHRFQTGDLLLLAKAASDAIAAVSPETRVGLCAPGGFPERETAEIARALAGRHRPVVRWWGSVYGYDCPVEASGLLFSAQWAKENLPQDVECMYEADPCPHSRFYASAARMEALVTTTLAFGYSAPLFQALGGRADALATSPDYIDMHRRCMGRFAAVKAEGAKGRLVGVQAFFDPDTRVGGIGGSAKRPLDVAAWHRSLNRLGIPVTTAESSVKLFAGHHAFRTMDGAAITNLLSGRLATADGRQPAASGVFLDGAAAEALTERGFAPLIGVRATTRDRIDFIGEHQTEWAGTGVSFGCTFHQNYGLDGCAVSRLESAGAVNVTEFSAGAKRQPAITYFENALGGKVAVMAVNLANCKTPNFFSYAKRELLVKVFRRLGGDRAVPVRNTDRANVMLVANDDGERLLLEAVNLSCDPADQFVFETMPPYAGGKVEILDGAAWRDAGAAWDGGRFTVKPPAEVDVYGTLVMRIAK